MEVITLMIHDLRIFNSSMQLTIILLRSDNKSEIILNLNHKQFIELAYNFISLLNRSRKKLRRMEERFRLFIADHPFFKGISQSDRIISEVVRNSKIRKIEQYRILINHEEPLYNIYFVLDGQVSIFVKKQKMELDYERELRLHFEDIKKKYDFSQQNEKENKLALKKAEMKLKNAFKQVDRNEKQYEDPIYKQAFPSFEAEYMTNKFNIFPLKRILTLNAGQVIGEIGINANNNRFQERISNITVVTQTRVTVAMIPIDYLNNILPLKKPTTILRAFESYFGGIVQKDLPLISQFFEKQIFEKNKIIFRNKENTDKIYVIGGGEVELSVNINNSQQRLMLLLENDIFGHENFSYERSYKATSLSNETFIYSIEKQLFFELIENKILFSQLSALGDEKIKRSLSVLIQNLQFKNDSVKQQELEEMERFRIANSHLDPSKLKQLMNNMTEQKKAIQLPANKVLYQEGNISIDQNSSLIIQGSVNTSTVYEKRRSYTNNGSDRKDANRSVSKTLPDRTPLKNKQVVSDHRLEIPSPSPEQAEEMKKENEDKLDRIVTSSDKYKKYKYGFGRQKKETIILPSISSAEQNNEDKKKRGKSPPKMLNDSILFQNEKLKEAQIQLEEAILLNQKSNITVTSFESKDTQIAFQKTLAVHQSISNELTKPSITQQPKSTTAFLQDLSQQENFLEIQDKIKQTIFRKKQKSPSPSKGRNRDGIDYIIQGRLKKMKSRHHSIENVNSSSMKNHQTVMPLDVQFKMERAKYKKEVKKNEESSEQLKTEISLHITDQMRAITPLQSTLQQEKDEFSSNFTLRNDVLKNLSQLNNDSSIKDLDKSIISQKYISLNVNNDSITSADLQKGDSQLGSYNLVKLNKKKKHLKYSSNKKQENDLIRQSSELKYIDYEGITLTQKMNPPQDTDRKQPLKLNQKLTLENDSKAGFPLSNRNISIQQQQQLIISGEQKLIKDKMSSQPINGITTSSIMSTKKPLQTIQLNFPINNKGQTLHVKKLSDTLVPLQKTHHNTIDTLIMFEQSSTSQILNHQTTMPLMQKINNPSTHLMTQKQKNRSMTIDEPIKLNQKLNVTEILDNPRSTKKTNSSVSPMYRIQKDTLNTENSIIEESSPMNLDHPVIHQNKKKFNKLPEILKHKAYIQKKLKRQFIRSPQVNERFDIQHFNKHIQMYQDHYNSEKKNKLLRQTNQEIKTQQTTQDTKLSQYVDSQIFSLSQPIIAVEKESNTISKDQQQDKPVIKINSESIDVINSSQQQRSASQNQNNQFKQYAQTTSQSTKMRRKKQYQDGIETRDNENNIDSLYSTLYVKKIMKDSRDNSKEKAKKEKSIFDQGTQSDNKEMQKGYKSDNEPNEQDSAIRAASSSSNYSVNKNKLEQDEITQKENNESKSPNQIKKTNSSCSFAFGSPIKYNISQLAQEQNKLLSINRDPKAFLSSFYAQSNSPIPNQQPQQQSDKKQPTIQISNNESVKLKREPTNSQIGQRQPSIKTLNNQQNQQQQSNLQSVSLANNDLSHLSIIKQLEIQRQTDAIFSFQSHNSPKNE